MAPGVPLEKNHCQPAVEGLKSLYPLLRELDQTLTRNNNRRAASVRLSKRYNYKKKLSSLLLLNEDQKLTIARLSGSQDQAQDRISLLTDSLYKEKAINQNLLTLLEQFRVHEHKNAVPVNEEPRNGEPTAVHGKAGPHKSPDAQDSVVTDPPLLDQSHEHKSTVPVNENRGMGNPLPSLTWQDHTRFRILRIQMFPMSCVPPGIYHCSLRMRTP